MRETHQLAVGTANSLDDNVWEIETTWLETDIEDPDTTTDDLDPLIESLARERLLKSLR